MSETIGPLRARVRLERPSLTPDNIGGGSVQWIDEGSVWAQVRAGSSSLDNAFDAAVSTSRYSVEVRARAGVRAGWRVVWGVRVLRVMGVRDAGGARISLDCEEESA